MQLPALPSARYHLQTPSPLSPLLSLVNQQLITMTKLTLQDPTPGPPQSGDSSNLNLTHLDPIPSYEEAVSALPGPRPNALQILGATWGGVTVTADLQKLVGTSDKLALDMRTLHRHLHPDPAPGQIKVLTLLYRFEDDDNDDRFRLFSAAENAQPSKTTISRHAHANNTSSGGPRGRVRYIHEPLPRPWRAGPQGQVDILAVLYGPARVETASVLSVLSNHFEGRWGQVRMNNAFFGADPWPYERKSWVVYFRFVGGSRRVQVVTGWENGALEVPWTRD
ncbi:hypothetical protein N658DRAFT_102420 [Parathielavia hyrcaniae]|uniref:Uncharacterized protein n=1 Tax=Parathielavia hyrcaniae TaxID=113614 RepID=A0AAN6PYQ5_9PEZI|nr:hypothetical protein N658DRAFT_102420 [Parathielavia hyrcaniae]